ISLKSDLVELKPPSLSFVEAATLGTAANTAVCAYLNHAKFDPNGNNNKNILVIGASGAVGSWAVLIGKLLGASVTGVCSSKNSEFVESLSADKIIQYDLAPLEQQLTQNGEFDVIIDCVGGDNYWELAQRILKNNGNFVTVVGPVKDFKEVNLGFMMKMIGVSLYRPLFIRSHKYGLVSTGVYDHFTLLHRWVTERKLVPIIGAIHPLTKFMDGFNAMESGHARGKQVINFKD
ncbi:hypothetical protein HK096_011263, partial [Nowakowskiella sp. JEL0078]